VPLPVAVAELAATPVREAPPGARRLTPEERARRAKLGLLAAAGLDPYPVSVPRTTTLGALRDRSTGLPPGARTGVRESVTGRVRALRDFGGLVFAELHEDGCRVQALLTREGVGEDALRLFRRAVDRGDHVGVTGEVVTSGTGELSVLASSWVMAAKCLEPVPGTRERLTDPETRVRRRHLDLIVDPDAAALVRARGRAVGALRGVLAARGFDEVETPVLQTVHGGASARPFETTINAYGVPLYLRIAPELYLKRLVVGGVQRVYELGRNFRNEGADATHNPEFTTIECYEAYGDYRTQAELTRRLILNAAMAVNGNTIIRGLDAHGVEHEIDLAEPWQEVTVYGGISERLGEEVTPETSVERLRELADKADVPYEQNWGHGQIVLEMIERLLEENIVAPTFVMDYPTEVSPLARKHRANPGVAEKWDLVILGTERATAFSELIDPIDQRERLTAQSLLAAGGDEEAMQLDEDFLRALEYGMPPTGGMGMGMDRLIMMLTGKNIRETILFPLVRPGS
jgi:lysyl-tRNA synthetase class 2